MGAKLPPISLCDEDPPLAHSQLQIYDPGDFLKYMSISDVETETYKRKQTAGDHLLAAWLPECPTFLDEMIHLKGHGEYTGDSQCGHSKTQATVQSELAHVEAAELESSTNISPHADVSPSILISSEIDLEDQQQCLSLEIAALSVYATDTQLTKLLYMLFVSLLHTSEEPCSPTKSTPVEAFQLWLPSVVSPNMQCAAQLHTLEWKLRYAQANNALKDICNLLHLRSHLYKFKDSSIVGQAANTHTRSTINKADAKVNMATKCYKVARAVLANLAPILNEDQTWIEVFKQLN
ncbi:hypothetical protein BDR04DRAFT_1158166 [Suillus decipiens]|nr:hypothetical protein BDR04DRAFT_1158166 [Suillus decipiens]